MKTTLFVFTKLYPFGRGEQYIADEQPYLAEKFDRIVFVPCEVFSMDQQKEARPVPANAEVLLLNDEVAKARKGSRHALQLAGVFFREWSRVPEKIWFWKERKRYLSVLFHQSRSADVLNRLLETKYAGSRHCFYAYWIHNSSIMLGLMKKRNMINEFVMRGHSIDLYDWDWTPTRTSGLKVLPFHYFNIEMASWIFPISVHGEQFLKKKFPQYREKIKAYRLGVPESKLNPADETAVFTIVTCGRVLYTKGIHKIPEILRLLKFPVRWVHFGGDGNASEVVNRSIATLPGTVTVELRGHTPNQRIKQFYTEETVHLFVGLSEVEGIPVSIMEAISAGIPVLASNVYGTPEVANEETGICIPYETPLDEVAALITQLHDDQPRLRALRKSAHEFYRKAFHAPTNYQRFCEELNRHFH